jgi:hypothetical protein
MIRAVIAHRGTALDRAGAARRPGRGASRSRDHASVPAWGPVPSRPSMVCDRVRNIRPDKARARTGGTRRPGEVCSGMGPAGDGRRGQRGPAQPPFRLAGLRQIIKWECGHPPLALHFGRHDRGVRDCVCLSVIDTTRRHPSSKRIFHRTCSIYTWKCCSNTCGTETDSQTKRAVFVGPQLSLASGCHLRNTAPLRLRDPTGSNRRFSFGEPNCPCDLHKHAALLAAHLPARSPTARPTSRRSTFSTQQPPMWRADWFPCRRRLSQRCN